MSSDDDTSSRLGAGPKPGVRLTGTKGEPSGLSIVPDPAGGASWTNDVGAAHTDWIQLSARAISRQTCFVVLSGPEEGLLFKPGNRKELSIGRGHECQIQLTDTGISRVHARITIEGNVVVLEDMNSRNGIFVGADRVTRHVLAPEDVISLGGNTILKFCYIDTVEEEHQLRLLSAALRDPLTGAYNRRHFDDRLAAECASARRHGRLLSLLIVDIDHFKNVNDRHGHVAGDTVLKGVKQVLEKTARREDTLFRYGGEEFAILAPDTDGKGALKLAERLLSCVAVCQFAQDIEPAGIKVTISIGAAQFAEHMKDSELVGQADGRLYEAKRQGRNRVVAS